MRRLAIAFLAAAPALGCAADSPAPIAVERVDSAGIAIVYSRGADVPLEWSFEPVLTLGGADEGAESFFDIGEATLAADAQGWLYILDRGNHRVLVFDTAGNHRRTLGRKGGGPGEFQFWPSRIAVGPDGSVHVYDFGKRGLVRFAADGAVLPTRRIDAYLPDGDFSIADSALFVRVMGRDGSDLRAEKLVLLHSDEDTTTLVSRIMPELKPVDYGCVRISGMAPLFSGSLVWAARGPRIVVNTGAPYVIDVYESGRRIASLRRDVEPRPADRGMAIREVGEKFEVTFGSGGSCVVPPEEVVEKRGYAEVLPTIHTLAVAPDGMVWVRRGHVKGDDAPVDLFTPEGEYSGTLRAGSPYPAAFLPGGRIVAVEKDELDIQRVVVYRVTRAGGPTAGRDA